MSAVDVIYAPLIRFALCMCLDCDRLLRQLYTCPSELMLSSQALYLALHLSFDRVFACLWQTVVTPLWATTRL